MSKPTLYIFSGLPGAGKSSLAKELAKATGATYLRIDTIEQAIRDLCDFTVEGEGYRLSYRVASDNLELGKSVIADSCNPIILTRIEWNEIATKSDAHFINIEVICSDKHEHKKRVECRNVDVAGLTLPTWEQVENREYHLWSSHRITIDTATRSISSCMNELLENISTEEKRLTNQTIRTQQSCAGVPSVKCPMDIKLRTNTEDPKLEFLKIEKYDDQSGYGSTINVASNGFSAKVFFTFEEWSMDEFIKQLEACDRTLSGEATLKPQWDNWFITFSLNGRGQVTVNGMLYTPEQELKYEFTTDQTCLAPLITDFKSWRNQ